VNLGSIIYDLARGKTWLQRDGLSVANHFWQSEANSACPWVQLHTDTYACIVALKDTGSHGSQA